MYLSCLDDHQAGLFILEILAILCFIGSSIPAYMMCCCTIPPSRAGQVRSRSCSVPVSLLVVLEELL